MREYAFENDNCWPRGAIKSVCEGSATAAKKRFTLLRAFDAKRLVQEASMSQTVMDTVYISQHLFRGVAVIDIGIGLMWNSRSMQPSEMGLKM